MANSPNRPLQRGMDRAGRNAVRCLCHGGVTGGIPVLQTLPRKRRKSRSPTAPRQLGGDIEAAIKQLANEKREIMYECEIHIIRYRVRIMFCLHGLPRQLFLAMIRIHYKHGSQNTITTTLIRNQTEATQVFNPPDCPVPDARHGQGSPNGRS